MSCIGSQAASLKNCFSTSLSRLRLVGGSPCGSCRCRRSDIQQLKESADAYCVTSQVQLIHYTFIYAIFPTGLLSIINEVHWPCSVEVKAGPERGVWWARTCQSIPSPAGTAAGPWGPEGEHLQGRAGNHTNSMNGRNNHNNDGSLCRQKEAPDASYNAAIGIWLTVCVSKVDWT